MDEIKLAYIAGFFDGEGCIVIARKEKSHAKALSPQFILQVSLHNTHKESVMWLHETFGGSFYEHSKKDTKYAKGWRWQANSRIAANFLRTIYPHLIIKAPEAEIALAFQEQVTQRLHITDRPTGKMPRLTEAEIQYRQDQMTALVAAKHAYKEYRI